jgi:hypothetical protein
VFKTTKNIAGTNKRFMYKVKCYKYLTKCFQAAGNYTLSVFYAIKLLQIAWHINSLKYELEAYDLLAIQYFYLGEVQKAHYYHERMLSGRAEAKDSEIRKLGINKMLNKAAEIPKDMKKEFIIKNKFEELMSLDYPESEDEFELPAPNIQAEEEKKEEAMDKRMKKEKNSSNHEKAYALRRLIDINMRYKKREQKHPRFVKVRELSELAVIRAKNEAIMNPPKPAVLISHLSPNRFLNNFHIKEARMMGFAKELGAEALVLLDTKSLELIKKTLEKALDNYLQAERDISRMIGKIDLLTEKEIQQQQKLKARIAHRLSATIETQY